MAIPANEFYQDCEKRFAGNISCACGNCDWKEFLYIYAGPRVVAGCKQCGRIQEFDNDNRDVNGIRV